MPNITASNGPQKTLRVFSRMAALQAVPSFHRALAKIGPSLLACDLSNMSEESKRVLDAGADFLHLVW